MDRPEPQPDLPERRPAGGALPTQAGVARAHRLPPGAPHPGRRRMANPLLSTGELTAQRGETTPAAAAVRAAGIVAGKHHDRADRRGAEPRTFLASPQAAGVQAQEP